MAESPNLSRNDFVKIIVGTVGAAIGVTVGLPAIGYVISPALHVEESDAWIAAGPLETYPIGIPTLFNFTRTKTNGWEKTSSSYGVYILRKSESEVQALSNTCTHLSCRVTWQEEAQEYVCPCHDAKFSISGEVVDGPPPRPLDPYETKVEEGVLYIHYKEG